MTRSFRWMAALVAVLGTADARATTEISVAVYEPGIVESVKAAIPAFELQHPDVKVNLVARPFGRHNKLVREALESNSADQPDVVAVEVGFVQGFVETGALEDLSEPPYEARPLLSQQYGFALPVATRNRRILAIPAGVGPGALFYRKDVLDEAGVTEEELTRSWDSFIEAGKKLKAATGARLLRSASDIVNIAIRNGLKEGEGIFFDAKGDPLVDSPRFQQAFALARKAHEAGVDSSVEMWTGDWVRALDRGTIATQPLGSWFSAVMKELLVDASKGQWRVAPLPGGAFGTWGGDYVAIPKRAAHKAEAWAFVKFLCFDREQQVRAFRRTGMWPALRVAQDDGFLDEEVPFFGGQRVRQVWKASAAGVPVIPANDRDAKASDAVMRALRRVLRDGEDVAKVLKETRGELAD